MSLATRVDRCDVSVLRVPTDCPESDGTLEWNSTTVIIVEVRAGGVRGLGFSYAGEGAACTIRENLQNLVIGSNPFDVTATWDSMITAVRNLGRPGLASGAISAVDVALWDLKAGLLGVPLVKLLGQRRSEIQVYGSGGFTSYSLEQLEQQLGGWAEQGFGAVKMKIGREPDRDRERISAARKAIGERVDLYVDANGAHTPKVALAQARSFEPFRVTWFEEPVPSDDLAGLRFVRQHVQSAIEVAAGEYGYDHFYFRRMLEAGAVDVLQADATRCGGFTGFMQAASLAQAFHIPLSAHTAPAIHLHACCAAENVRNLEYFHDHVRIEDLIFEGAQHPGHGQLKPDLDRPGLGLTLKRREADKFRVR